MTGPAAQLQRRAVPRGRSDVPFLTAMWIIAGFYIFLIVAMLVADTAYVSADSLLRCFAVPEIRASIVLSLVTCSLSAILSLWVAVPIGYLLSRCDFRGKALLDAILDIPIALPPLVIGLSLLILFQTPIGDFTERFVSFTYARPGIVLAQFSVACAFAVRTMRATFEQINPRQEQVALTLGCTQGQAFWLVVLPEARQGLVTAGTLAWARAMGEFGPILVFVGATRMKTEVLPTTVFLELSVGRLDMALAVSLLMICAAVAVLVVVRVYGNDKPMRGVI